MTAERIDLNVAQFEALAREVHDREQTIISGMLQQPDYPPLPACPECGTRATKLTEQLELDNTVLVDFLPCDHRFRAPTWLDILDHRGLAR